MLDDLGQDLFKPLDNRAFRFAKRHLIGNLKDVAQSFSSFSIKAADRQPELVYGLNDRVNLLGQDQAGQMEHRADSNSGSDIGRAGRQVTEFSVKGVIELLFERGIGLVNGR